MNLKKNFKCREVFLSKKISGEMINLSRKQITDIFSRQSETQMRKFDNFV